LGAWLSFIVSAKHPSLVRKLVLIGSGPFETGYVGRIQATRLSRLNEGERAEYESIINVLDDPGSEGKATAFARLGALASRTDEYDPMDRKPDETDVDGKQATAFMPF